MTLIRNAGFNFLGAAAPAVLAVATIPYIISVLGTGDYGLLILITSIVGYFALLDINITAGSTKYVAQYHASGDTHRLNETICFGLLIYVGIGVVGMMGLFFSARFLVAHVFTVSANKQAEAILALQIAAFGFATGQVQAYVQSLPGALMRFDISGRIEAVFGTMVPLATVALLYFGFDLVDLVLLRVAMSILQTVVVWRKLIQIMPFINWAVPSIEIRNTLLSFSAYSFLSKLAALTYNTADKLIIGASAGVTALTFYVVPATLANRVMSLVFRFSGVMFPHASALAEQGRLVELKRDYLLASRYMFFINGGIALMLATLAHPILSLWMSTEFARVGTTVMVMIAFTQWIDSLTNLPTLINDGIGHPKISGIFALARAVLGLGLIFLGVWRYGIVGAAGAHLLASAVMSLSFVIYVHGRTVPVSLNSLFYEAYLVPLIVLVPVGIVGVLLTSFASRGWLNLLACGTLMGLLILVGGICKVCLPQHRNIVFSRLALFCKSNQI
ncbi:oligosaccharide flippase family protein [Glaciimonas immobilis]|uniref:O-antigen/teichoic acid export membrane protein n=1 Tax=Glaciimonas immobilis TaxID=728004 RepID=A0A840RMZ3_9BURK|nr:oligosaccharide flippase family protein [Glaciimonas immobilis]KAF3998159.1 oligosaccharide flippase family protein [Glaciimonas immobilis]MBB5199133.1 O-antigen/teichoic acid export membrane protein [Glaciimonas immobilis]